jgi:peptide/nickel transport system permease protein
MFFFQFRFFFLKLGISLLTLAAVVILSFILIVNMPGTVIDSFAMELSIQRRISLDQAMILAKQMLNYDPDASLFSRFSVYIQQLAQGNLGISVKNNAKSVNVILVELLPRTLFISSLSLAISFVFGTFLGSRATWKRNSIGAKMLDGYVVVSNTIPDYIVALILITIFAFRLGWFPNQGAYDAMIIPGFNLPFILSVLFYASLPVAAYVFSQLSFWTMQMQGSAMGVLGEDFINAARARGIPKRIIVRKYLKRNAMLPLVTQLAISFGVMFGGAPLMESIFNYPGIGQAFSQAIVQRDYYVVQGILLFVSVIVIGVNLIADTIYSQIDPRVRRSA